MKNWIQFANETAQGLPGRRGRSRDFGSKLSEDLEVIGLAKLAPGAGGLELVQRPVREPAEGEAELAVHATGICGTDLHIAAGEYSCVPPVTLGHEVCGTVTRLGAGVDPRWLGERVVCETYSSCRRCRRCREGRFNLCPQRRSIGTHTDGGFAPLIVVPETSLHRVPDWLADHTAALSEPLACVCHALLDPSAVAPGDDVLVIGPGPVGLLAAQVARALGGEVEVRGLPSDVERLSVASRLGFATGCDTATNDGTVDVAIDASGAATGIAECLGALRPGGRFVQIGIAGKPVTVPLDLVLLRELEVATGFASTPASWWRAMQLIEAREIQLDPLVSEVAPLSEWERAFAALGSGQGMKIVLDPRLDGAGEPNEEVER